MNRLQHETSPYLQQHADNPVDWYPWGEEALALAKREKKPILLSIGYAACHWCHVMAHESFENRQTAKSMNKHFVNIKVDREERPDIDRIYQAAHQILNRAGGGWPLTVFLDPVDHMPVFAGTYFPPQARGGRPGFRDVVTGMAKAFREDRERMGEMKPQLKEALGQILGGGTAGEPDEKLVERACAQIDASFDAKRGGFSDAPKFPHPAGLELLHDAAAALGEGEKADRALAMLDLTLAAMARGGVRDHLGGGFFRYSVDADWDIPHFEKMLYDNGQLLSLYARRAEQTGSAWLQDVTRTTASWLLRDMRLPGGGFASSLDADSKGEEGAYYVWVRDDISETLGDAYDAFADCYRLRGRANFERRWHLRLAPPDADAALAAPDIDDGIARSAASLLELREQREKPGRDDKVLTGWNALTIRGLADAGRVLGDPALIDAAAGAVDYLRDTHWRDGRLLATSRDGKARLNAYLDDHAFLIDALLALLAARWRDADLHFACELADAMLERFADQDRGGFYFTADDHEDLIQRSRSFADDALPCGNPVAIRGLFELGFLLGEPRYTEAAERGLRAGMGEADRWPSAHATLVRALQDFMQPPTRLIVRGDAQAVAAAVNGALDARGRCYVIPSAAELPGLLASRGHEAGAAFTAYLCRGHECSLPLTDADALRAALSA